jgi:hypothetical protein
MGDRGSSAVQIQLSDEDRAVLEGWAGGGDRLAVRARIVLGCAEPGAVTARVAGRRGLCADGQGLAAAVRRAGAGRAD